MDPVEPGLACGSDTAHMSLFGYDPRHLYRGRGAYESMGAGLEMHPGDIAFKCNFATLDPGSGIVLRRRADRRFDEEGPLLCAALDSLAIPGFPEHVMSVKYATEHRCGVVIRGPGLTDAISGTDPLKDNLPLLQAAPLDASPEAAHTAAVVNSASVLIQEILGSHPVNAQRVAEGKPPANVVLLRGCGCRLALPPFERVHGMRGCMVSPTKIIAGLGMCAGIHVLDVPGATGDYKTLFHRKAEAIAAGLTSPREHTSGAHSPGTFDFAFLHVKAVDDAGHDGSVALKVGYLGVVDAMVGQVVRLLWEAEQAQHGRQRYTIVVTGDHSTPVEFGDHSNEPVPFAIAHVRHAVHALGGNEAAQHIALGPIPHPSGAENGAIGALLERNNGVIGSGGLARAVWGDGVAKFSEVDATEGALGRFPGSQMLGVVKQFAGVAPCPNEA